MRRLLAAAAVTALVGGAAACGSDSGADDPPASAGNTTEVCAEVRAGIADATTKFGTEYGSIAATLAMGNTVDDATIAQFTGIFTEWAVTLRSQAEKATDPQLSGALTQIADGITAGVADIDTSDELAQAGALLESPELTAAFEQVNEICGP